MVAIAGMQQRVDGWKPEGFLHGDIVERMAMLIYLQREDRSRLK